MKGDKVINVSKKAGYFVLFRLARHHHFELRILLSIYSRLP